MLNSLDLKSYQLPEDLPQSGKELFAELMGDMEILHEHYESKVAFLKQQFKIALKAMRPGFITPETLGQLFDEAEMTAEPETEPVITDPEATKPKKKRRKKIKGYSRSSASKDRRA